jgi:hypothetical protein
MSPSPRAKPPDVVVILDPPTPEEIEARAQRLAALLLGGGLTPARKDGILMTRNDPRADATAGGPIEEG